MKPGKKILILFACGVEEGECEQRPEVCDLHARIEGESCQLLGFLRPVMP